MIALHRAARFFALIPSRHPVGSLTGWSALARITVAAFDDFSRPGRTPLAISPLAADPFPALPDYRHPYDSPRGAA